MAAFVKGSRERARARIALDGPSGSGKSVTALRFAHAMGKRIGVIDSERRSDLLYVGAEFDGVKFAFDHLELSSFSPAEYTSAIAQSAAAGHEVLVIDSLSHAWEGLDGALEIVSRKGGNSYTAWKDVTPLHRRMVDAILTFPGHVICTMRSKTEYVLETNANGKQVPRKIGMAPIQRPGMEYEFTLYCSLDNDHFLTVSKTRCSGLDGVTGHKPGASWLAPFVTWINTGEVLAAAGPRIEMATDAQVKQILQLVVELEINQRQHRAETFKRYSVEDAHLLTASQAAETIRIYEIRKAEKIKATASQPGTPAAIFNAAADATASGGENKTLQEGLAEMPGSPAQHPVSTENVGPVTDVQIRQLVLERDKLFTIRGLTTNEADNAKRVELWGKLLGLFDAKSARTLTSGQADKLLAIVASKINEEMTRQKAAGAKPPGENQPPAIPPAAPPAS